MYVICTSLILTSKTSLLNAVMANSLCWLYSQSSLKYQTFDLSLAEQMDHLGLCWHNASWTHPKPPGWWEKGKVQLSRCHLVLATGYPKVGY